jgi:Asp-tRNA(Asn)/Glu-tRNA(Gln) amidotransferase A subunit family amidase
VNENIFFVKSIGDIHRDFKSGVYGPVDIAKVCIARVEKLDELYHAWKCFNLELFLRQAEKAQKRIQRGEALRPLEGIPVGVKDIMNTAEFPTQMGSPIWKDFAPGNDARIVFYIKEAGGIVPGKTETAEFAVHTLGETINPFKPDRTPGTSSSGSAVAIALGMVPVALGTQTAGSIVRPASFCGIYGCKPSFGLIPRTGMLKTTDSLDTVGYFTARFDDLERVFEVIRVKGPDYPLSYKAFNDKSRQSKPVDRPWRVALVKTHTWTSAYGYAREALLKWVARAGKEPDIEVVEADLPAEMEKAHRIHATIYNKTLSYYFKEEFRKSELVSPIMQDLIRDGNSITVAQYLQAIEDQMKLAHLMDKFFLKYDIIVSLSTAGDAPLREEVERPDPALMWTMTHLSVISVPTFRSPDGLPFGVQLAARRYNDILLFKFARCLRSMNLIPEGPNPLMSHSGRKLVTSGA